INQNVNTWWPGKLPSTSVFKYAGGYISVDTTKTGLGYWMKNTSTQTYNTGDEWPAGGIIIVPVDPIAVASGWNMIGVYHYNVLKAAITSTGGSLTGSIYKYSAGYQPVDTLKPGYGYWAKMTAAGTLILPSSAFQGVVKQVETDTKDWGRIVITDNSGKIYTLYGVKGLVDLNNYELPPVPNVEMFDVRYGSNRYAEDLTTGNQSIEMQGMEYPVKVRAENMGIRLQDASGNGLNERLKSGEEVTISNSAISKLLVSGDLIPDVYALEQNYPNPFNPSTKIEFSIPEDVNNVTLTIYNALGQRVAELVNSKMEAGKYSYVWNVPQSGIATGLYIYELRTDKFVSVKKMMLLK
ncbi:MAG: T9SS type A sorting domain-containing protein, partial [Ignavibacteria bacterium]|nr:T9SS type A sorting domain-containing protein [Ignavibacteria bacterium]